MTLCDPLRSITRSTRHGAAGRVGLVAALLFVLAIRVAEPAGSAEPPITAIAFAADGQSVVVGSQSGLSVHDWPDLKLKRKLGTALISVHDLAFSPTGKSLAVAGGTPSEQGLVELIAWPSGESQGLLDRHDDTVLAVDWKDDSTLASASLDHEVIVWDVRSRKPVQRFNGHSRGVSAICYLPAERLLVSGSIDQNLRVWDTQSARMIRTLNNHTKEIRDVALAPSGDGLPMIASVSDDRTVRLWQPTIGRMVRFAQLGSTPLAVCWLPDGSRMAVATTAGKVLLIDPETVDVVAEISAVQGWAYSLATHPFDGSLLVGGRNGQLKRIYLLETAN